LSALTGEDPVSRGPRCDASSVQQTGATA
jgi:hypothetical protein